MKSWDKWVFGAMIAAAWALGAETAAACNLAQINVCMTQFPGSVATPDATGRCQCVVFSTEPRRVTNARRGDVGLVPIFTGRGSPVVRAALAAVGQNHRHSVLFLNNGRNIRHSTLDDDAVTSVRMPVFHLNAVDLMNGRPGIISQSVDDAFDGENLDDVGLILKPQSEGGVCFIGQPCVTDRDRFESAATLATTTFGYYKLSDYTDLDSMSLPYAPWLLGNDQRGSHCSGFLRYLFEQQGYSIPLVQYGEAVRQGAADDIFSVVRADVEQKLRDQGGLGLYPNGPTNAANQITNCFADLGCDNYSDDWRAGRVGVGTGQSVSPDNLLPQQFTLRGGSYTWDGAVRNAGAAITNSGGNTSTPFQRVEVQQMSGGGIIRTVVHTF